VPFWCLLLLCAGLGAVTTVTDLAEDLHVDPGDLPALLAQLGEWPETASSELAAEVRDQLDHLGERTVPAIWWPGSDPDAGSGATR
jgi:hypothetical protein